MGKVDKIYHEELIDPVPSRNNNLLRVYRALNGEVTIHFRNLKIVLHTLEEIAEWKIGFTKAYYKFNEGNYFPDDI